MHVPGRLTRSRVAATALRSFVAAAMLLPTLPAPTHALPNDPIDPSPVVEVPFQPPPNGFRWSVPSRFGARRDGLVDYHWDASTGTYDPAHVRPARFPMHFNGCLTREEQETGESANTYRWEDADSGQLLEPRRCQFTHDGWPGQGTYRVRLTITDPAGNLLPAGRTAPFEQQVVVRDYLIVSIGDSYGSGEGNPDVPQVARREGDRGIVESPARWVDERCHRSAYAGAAQAALSLEQADAKTSVTFISLACSGATIERPTYKDNDLAQPQGSGVLRGYRGAAPPPGTGFSEAERLPAQLDAVSAAVGDRVIDALVVSGGGNDIGFADIAAICVANAKCYETEVPEGYVASPHSRNYALDTVVERHIAALAGIYDRLAEAIHDPAPAGRAPLKVANVFLMEYPDPTKNEEGDFCPQILNDIAFWPLDMSAQEAEWATRNVLAPLNQQIRAAVDRHAAKGWRLVSGVSDAFSGAVGGAHGHGYCAADNWIRTATESIYMQGPFPAVFGHCNPVSCSFSVDELEAKKHTIGTLHPTAAGHRAYRDRLLDELKPRLSLTLPTPPGYSVRYGAGTTSTRRGGHGWLTGVCASGEPCTSDGALLTVAVTHPEPISAASVTVDGGAGCAAAGMTCAEGLTAPDTYEWTLDMRSEGIRRVQFTSQDRNRQVGSFTHEVKVDLADPSATASVVAGRVVGGRYRPPVGVRLDGADSPAGSGMDRIEYRIDDGEVRVAPPGGVISITADGVHTVRYQAIDRAGRRSGEQTLGVSVARPEGHLHAWGRNSVGELGAPSSGSCDGIPCATSPAPVGALGQVVDVAAGTSHSLALEADGTVWAAGWNASGQLGNPSVPTGVGAHSATFVQAAIADVAAISANGATSLALKADGTVWAWGDNDWGQMGLGGADADPHPLPTPVPGLSGVVAIAAGQNHNLAVTSNGTIWGWGHNASAQLGRGCSADACSQPVHVGTLPGVVALAAGERWNVALRHDGTVWIWGGWDPQTFEDRVVPVQIPALAGTVQVAVSTGWVDHVLALGGDGTVRGFGDNSFGQLGIPPSGRIDEMHPVQVSGLGGVLAVAAGGGFSLAVKDDGTVWGWGVGDSGQLGDGTTPAGPLTYSPTPTRAIGLSGGVGVAAGGTHSLGIAGGPLVDRVPPATTAEVSPAGNAAGWHRSAVTVTLSARDDEHGSGVAAITYSATGAQPIPSTNAAGATVAIPVTVEGETILRFSATDVAGNVEATGTVTVSLDRTPPTLAFGTPSPGPNAAGWHNSDVSFPVTAGDPLSGVAGPVPPAPLVVTGEGTAVTGTVILTDVAGNSASFTSPAVRIDRTAPATTHSLDGTEGSSGWLKAGLPAQLRLAATDGLSGVAATRYAVNGGSPLIYSGPVTFPDGRYTVRFWSTDRAGNTEPATTITFKVDQTPPILTCSATPRQLWPADRGLRDVEAAVRVTDALSGPGAFVLDDATSSEPDAGLDARDLAGDILGFTFGTADTRGQLRAERSGRGDGRLYALTYGGADEAGNTASCSVTVSVPHDQGG